MAHKRRKRRSRKRIFIAYLLRTLCVAILIALIAGVVFLVKYFMGNVSIQSKASEYTENTIEITKKGSITGDIYEEFAQSYYDGKELSDMVDKEIADYNKLTGDNDAVKLSDFNIDGGVAKLSIDYKDATEYRGFNSTGLYLGTVAELLDNGIVIDKNLIDVSDATKFISTTDINSIADYKAVVTDEDVVIVCPSKILYYTSNVELLDKNSGRAKASSDYAVIIYK